MSLNWNIDKTILFFNGVALDKFYQELSPHQIVEHGAIFMANEHLMMKMNMVAYENGQFRSDFSVQCDFVKKA